jgi:hypothetical protein
MKNIFAIVNVEESFPKEFGIFKLKEFLTVLKLLNKPTLDFSYKGYVVMKGGDQEVHFFSTDPMSLTVPPKTFSPPELEINFPFPKSTISSIVKFGNELDLPHLVMSSSGDEEVEIRVEDLKNVTRHHYSQVLKVDEPVKRFELQLGLGNLKMIPDDYEFSVSLKTPVTRWVGSIGTYWIAGDKVSV